MSTPRTTDDNCADCGRPAYTRESGVARCSVCRSAMRAVLHCFTASDFLREVIVPVIDLGNHPNEKA